MQNKIHWCLPTAHSPTARSLRSNNPCATLTLAYYVVCTYGTDMWQQERTDKAHCGSVHHCTAKTKTVSNKDVHHDAPPNVSISQLPVRYQCDAARQKGVSLTTSLSLVIKNLKGNFWLEHSIAFLSPTITECLLHWVSRFCSWTSKTVSMNKLKNKEKALCLQKKFCEPHPRHCKRRNNFKALVFQICMVPETFISLRKWAVFDSFCC